MFFIKSFSWSFRLDCFAIPTEPFRQRTVLQSPSMDQTHTRFQDAVVLGLEQVVFVPGLLNRSNVWDLISSSEATKFADEHLEEATQERSRNRALVVQVEPLQLASQEARPMANRARKTWNIPSPSMTKPFFRGPKSLMRKPFGMDLKTYPRILLICYASKTMPKGRQLSIRFSVQCPSLPDDPCKRQLSD